MAKIVVHPLSIAWGVRDEGFTLALTAPQEGGVNAVVLEFILTDEDVSALATAVEQYRGTPKISIARSLPSKPTLLH